MDQPQTQTNHSSNRSIDFTTFVLSISSAAYMGLGLTPKPGAKVNEIDLELARQNIDLLDLLKEKTKNNLNSNEQKLLDHILIDTKMKFVEVQQKRK